MEQTVYKATVWKASTSTSINLYGAVAVSLLDDLHHATILHSARFSCVSQGNCYRLLLRGLLALRSAGANPAFFLEGPHHLGDLS